MNQPICTKIVVSYVECKRKAYYLLHGEPQGTAHDLDLVLERRADAIRKTYLASIEGDITQRIAGVAGAESSPRVLAGDLVAACDAITRKYSTRRRESSEPHLVVGAQSFTKKHRFALAFAAYVIGQSETILPEHGVLASLGGKPKRVKVASLFPQVRSIVDDLRELSRADATEPPLILCEACSTCVFRDRCRLEAVETDNLTLLDRMTPKLLKKYARRGVLTVNQLSYLFRPRRARKRSPAAQPSFNIELQALALRTKKIYLHDAPKLHEQPVEIYLDIEGIPEQGFDYLIGLLIRKGNEVTTRSFWADTRADEPRIFQECIDTIQSLPQDARLYHYGSYEKRAFQRVQEGHGLKCDALIGRLTNVNSMIFGKIYFPTYSNRLKDLGKFLGVSWSAANSTGIQSLAWRFLWEDTGNDEYKQRLLTYNREDCDAVRIVADELRCLSMAAHERPDVDVPTTSKRNSTKSGLEIHETFDRILKSAHLKYQDQRITIRPETAKIQSKQDTPKKKRRATSRRKPSGRANKIIHVPRKRTCLSCKRAGLKRSRKTSEHSLIELGRTKNGCKRFVVKYVGHQAFCPECTYYYPPPAIKRLRAHIFGRSIKCWAVHFRIVLRLPIRVISDLLDTLISEHVAASSVSGFVGDIADEYAATEELLESQLLASRHLHVDETKINVRGVDCYAWVVTDGQHVLLRFSESRQISVVEGLLKQYEGVVVSDFYGGYDCLTCKQQRCLVHLIRDLNEDLWKNPFNQDYELFLSKIRDMFVPIFEDVGKHGLKSRYLKKHMKAVDQFYRDVIEGQDSGSELGEKYKKRFRRYRESLFRFLIEDGIPWNNNMAERSLRHLSVQQKISGCFFGQSGADDYLRLLSISQTCRFQDKPFLDFLLSGERDIDQFKPPRRRQKPKAR
ncbi:Transposase IS66 family protein [Pirellulimonas nuda]|uniref:Transposase IS66 family protein n=1 Tax=Pirellulimonas nuda TaxID=2528009 RepID=A0A518DDA4_9BACT|nr:IS66 family transposase [Pirellulimonas nuda]QDU89461.1 Transposase IS66 family protein [Pirellulimonas nuda]